MKNSIRFILLLIFNSALAQSKNVNISTVDVENFWVAYDQITATKETARQYEVLDTQYIQKATPGLTALIAARNYTPKHYIDAINLYPKFWKSIRENTLSANELTPQIKAGLQKLNRLYPQAKPLTVYFAIGAFRTNGTITDGNILIGGEVALADNTTIVDELPNWRQPFYKQNSQIESVDLLVAHEYIHTLQKELVHNLLSMCLYEGIAEFVSCLALEKPSTAPAIEFGRENTTEVIDLYTADLFLMRNNNNWLWGENTNRLRVRDLGYYVGYEMAQRYYNLSTDKQRAIAELIELDYTNEAQVERIVDAGKLLPKPIAQLYSEFEKRRPTVVRIEPFKNHSKEVSPGRQKITVHFSEALNGLHTGVDFGPLGTDYFPTMSADRIWSLDKKSWTVEVDLQPNKQYQIMIDNSFRRDDGTPLKPYLLEFHTTK